MKPKKSKRINFGILVLSLGLVVIMVMGAMIMDIFVQEGVREIWGRIIMVTCGTGGELTRGPWSGTHQARQHTLRAAKLKHIISLFVHYLGSIKVILVGRPKLSLT